MNNNEEKILIAIASYCDNQLLNTIESALVQADNPDRVYFAICYQSDDLKDLNKLKELKNCKVKHLKESEARGSCYARYLCHQMIDDQKYIYQIDSHMRFVKHWDNKMIEQLLALNDPKASISTYPPNCSEEEMQLPINDKKFDVPEQGCSMVAEGFHDNLFPFIKMRSFFKDKSYGNRINPLISANNFFTFSDVYKSVIIDPEMFFYGDEFPMAIRYYTNGINNYSGAESYIYHEYKRENKKFPKTNGNMRKEQRRFMQLLDTKAQDSMGIYGLGKQRTLDEFQQLSGIDLKNRIIYMNAELGDFENEKYRNKVSYLMNKKIAKLSANNDKKIEVLIIDLFGEYDECIKTCLQNSTYSNNISFIVGTISDNIVSNSNIKKIVHYSKDSKYTQVLADLTNYLDDGYVAVVDSSFRFLSEWDEVLVKSINNCPQYSAITSWIWTTPKDYNKKLTPYKNRIRDFEKFENKFPVLKLNNELKIDSRPNPYQGSYISDGFLFCHSRVLKSIKIDPTLSYREHQIIYSLRLYTNGIDLFYPQSSHIYKTKPESFYYSENGNSTVTLALQGFDDNRVKLLECNYEFDIGNKRPLWMWYESINYNYTEDVDLFI